MIEVTKIADNSYEVTVRGATETKHHVTLGDDYYQKLTNGKESPERLIERSFEFLLRHESNTAIMPSFNLPVIKQFFPDYEREICD